MLFKKESCSKVQNPCSCGVTERHRVLHTRYVLSRGRLLLEACSLAAAVGNTGIILTLQVLNARNKVGPRCVVESEQSKAVSANATESLLFDADIFLLKSVTR